MIQITRDKVVLAEHDWQHSLACSYGQPVWSIVDPEPSPGPAVWEDYDSGDRAEIHILGVVGNWLVVTGPGGLHAIIWTEGLYYTEAIIDLKTGNQAGHEVDLDQLAGDDYLVAGTVSYPGSPLGVPL
ncbi:MAG: hypothetical protein RBS95_10685 [Desulfobulbus sp.]|jgi:hypothetical protein|nr:hypothetical protein [Desulfobulbus sp.]